MIFKRIMPILAGLVAVVSSVAAVSAFEAHTINVTAHVENALKVGVTPVAFGVVFPEDWLSDHANIELSDSFKNDQTRVTKVDYTISATCKPKPDNSGEFYLWLGEALWVDKNGGNYTNIGPAPNSEQCTAGESVTTGFTGTLIKGSNSLEQLSISLDVPVFEGFYNEWTDVCDKPRENFGGDDGVQSTGEEPTLADGQTDPRHLTRTDGTFKCQVPSLIIGINDLRYSPVTGVDLGIDLVVQVTNIYPE